MQTIYLQKFGPTLLSRPDGLEAFRAIRPTLNPTEPIEINFDDVLSVTPSWFDEFLTNLADFAAGNVELLPTDNPAVRAMLPILAKDRHDAAAKTLERAVKAMNLR